jgi:outer membrane autotransporter protein
MNTLSAELAVDNQIGSLYSGLRFDDALLGCDQARLGPRPGDAGRCGWVRLAGQGFTQHEVTDNLGFREDSVQLAAGAELAVGDGWWLGGALGYEQVSLTKADSNASSDGDRFQAGVTAKRRLGSTELSGSIAVSYGDYAIERYPAGRSRVDGTQRLWLYSGQLRAARHFDLGRWRLGPRIDLGVAHLAIGDFRESGGSGFLIRNDGRDDTYVSLQPALDIHSEIETRDGTLIRPRLSLGLTGFVGHAAASVSGRFDLAPDAVDPFSVRTELDRVRLDVAMGLDVLTRAAMTLRAEVFGSFSENTESYGGGLRVSMPF